MQQDKLMMAFQAFVRFSPSDHELGQEDDEHLQAHPGGYVRPL
jgi:hypothetical protein